MFSKVKVLYFIQAIRLLGNVAVLAIMAFWYSKSDIAEYFLALSLIQILFLGFGFFSTPYFLTRYVVSLEMAQRFAPRQLMLNLLSWFFIFFLTCLWLPQFTWLVLIFIPMTLARVCDDLCKSSHDFNIFLISNLISVGIVTFLKFAAILMKIEIIWFLTFVFLEECVRSIFYLMKPQFWFVFQRQRISRRKLIYYLNLIQFCFANGLASAMSGANYRILFLTLGLHGSENSVVIAGYFNRIFEVANGLLVQYSIYSISKDRPTLANLEKVMLPIYRFCVKNLLIGLAVLLLGLLLYFAFPIFREQFLAFLVLPFCIAVSVANINRVYIFTIFKQPRKLLLSSTYAFVFISTVWISAPYIGFNLMYYISSFLALTVVQSALFDLLFFSRMRHARLLRKVMKGEKGSS